MAVRCLRSLGWLGKVFCGGLFESDGFSWKVAKLRVGRGRVLLTATNRTNIRMACLKKEGLLLCLEEIKTLDERM